MGKSTLTLDLAARVTIGAQWPDGQPGADPASVLLLSAEDGLADTIRPRLEAAGADLTRVVAWDKEWNQQDVDWHLRPVVLPTDLGGLERRIRRDGALLVVVDVLVAYLSDRIDAHKDQDVRVLLSRLAEVADRTGAAIIMLRHLNKSGSGPAIYRGGGSIGIIGAARAGYQVIRDGDDPNRRLFACIKLNLAPEPPTLAYQLEGVPELGVARVSWEADPDPRSADDLHADAVTGPTKLGPPSTGSLTMAPPTAATPGRSTSSQPPVRSASQSRPCVGPEPRWGSSSLTTDPGSGRGRQLDGTTALRLPIWPDYHPKRPIRQTTRTGPSTKSRADQGSVNPSVSQMVLLEPP